MWEMCLNVVCQLWEPALPAVILDLKPLRPMWIYITRNTFITETTRSKNVCIQARMRDWRTPAWAVSVKRSRGATWPEDVWRTTVACLELPSSTGWTLASPHSNWMTPILMEVTYCLVRVTCSREHVLFVKEKYMGLAFYNEENTFRSHYT